MWGGKTDRAMRFLQERNEEFGIKTVGNSDQEIKLEKDDMKAMTIAAYLTIMPAAILALALMVGIPVLVLWLLSL